MIDAKQRFGYTYIITTNPIEQNILSAFCEGKGYIWNTFFGWRKTTVLENGLEQMYFWIPSDKVETLSYLSATLK